MQKESASHERNESEGIWMRVALLCGGRSGEHEVSVLSAKSVYGALLSGGFEVVLVGITKDGQWVFIENPQRFFKDGGGEVLPNQGPPCYILPDPSRPGLWINGVQGIKSATDEWFSDSIPMEKRIRVDESPKGLGNPGVLGKPAGFGARIEVDVVFPVLHGIFGEDGTIQGLLDLAGIPYVGSRTLASAICMDKDTTKMVLAQNEIPFVPAVAVKRRQWQKRKDTLFERILSNIIFPVFVKPSASGSSLGVSKVKNKGELSKALDSAFLYDLKVLIEPSQEGALEIECSVLGNDEPRASVAGQIIPTREFYDYEAKYLDQSTRLIIPAPLSEALMCKTREIAVESFVATGCSGLARVDLFVVPGTGDVYVNEINTMPGFTEVSMYSKLWEATGMPYVQLVESLVMLALERQRASGKHVGR